MKPADSPPQPALAQFWTRPVPIKWLDTWLERLAFLGATRLSVIEKPGAKTARIQAYPPDLKTAKKLVADFGGTLRQVKAQDWMFASTPREPIKVGQRLIICCDHDQAVEEQINHSRRIVLHIPCGLAFGTGDHATTGMILRELSALPESRLTSVLDIGTGSGVLALTARALRAKAVEAFDYDPVSIRTAKSNEAINFPTANIRWKVQDLQAWKPVKRYSLICANLFLETLVTYAPKIQSSLAPDGLLLVSGLLTEQGLEVEKAMRTAGLRLIRIKKKGKWLLQSYAQPPTIGSQ